jgi:hypothetical protein
MRPAPLLFAVVAAAIAIPAFASLALAKPAKASGETGITGMWILEAKDFSRDLKLPLTEAALNVQKADRAAVASGEVIGQNGKRCLPAGVPTIMANEFATEWLESPGRITIVNEDSPLVRSVYLDEKAHPKDMEPMWNGHSIGHWEGKGEGRTLVIDTVNFNDKAKLLGFIGVHSSTTHLVERYHLEAGGQKLVGTFTFEDPRYLTKPWTGVVHYKRLPPHSELWEYACEVGAEGWAERFKGDPAAKAQ